MDWQSALLVRIAGVPSTADVSVYGSAADPSTLDGWSDLDLRLRLHREVDAAELVPAGQIWAVDDVESEDGRTCRLVLTDGRRVDLSIAGRHRLTGLPRHPDGEVRFIAVMAAVRLGRGDRLIGLHLTLELLRHSLVEAMLLRDRDRGTTVHRFGSERDRGAETVAELVTAAAQPTPSPDVVERAAELYGRWRSERDPAYRPDWSGLRAVIDRGTGREPRPPESGRSTGTLGTLGSATGDSAATKRAKMGQLTHAPAGVLERVWTHRQRHDVEGTPMSLINDYYILSEVRQRHAELIAEAQAVRLARQSRAARRAARDLRRRLLGAQQPAPAEPTLPTIAPAEDRPAAEPAGSDREPVGACAVNSL